MFSDRSKQGVLFALGAYLSWGVAPLYFKALGNIPAPDILTHRVVWSVLVLVLFLFVAKQWGKVRAALRSKKIMLILAASAVLLAGNWLVFIWAVNNDHLLDASLGYYINPLLNVFLGRLFLGETLRPMQRVAVGCAFIGVATLLVAHGNLPWIALFLAASFGTYGLLRKKILVESMPGLLLESLMMLPFALYFWIFHASESSHFATNDWQTNALLISAGLVTTVPLIFFNAAAQRIKYSTLGFFQYLAPSMMFLMAVILFGEPLDEARLLTFVFVWAGLAIFTIDSLRFYRKERKLRKSIG
ncbi:EamA family transporter RarD [Alteromonas sp. a30]|uniref:EamA family transporter RarD n=1 Tax=Alteromonas sp. a30 TaxID=2730917 RepID=UPI002282775C|nr:EamA family transporter RarD [Alteromonas sp. a30]MCY7295711.1 EamA family transporter RarD [Alteromonas sp. a30]